MSVYLGSPAFFLCRSSRDMVPKRFSHLVSSLRCRQRTERQSLLCNLIRIDESLWCKDASWVQTQETRLSAVKVLLHCLHNHSLHPIMIQFGWSCSRQCIPANFHASSAWNNACPEVVAMKLSSIKDLWITERTVILALHPRSSIRGWVSLGYPVSWTPSS